jgi:hypothetical protein
MPNEIAELAKDVPFERPFTDYASFGLTSLLWMAAANDDEPYHWSPARDQWLRQFWSKIDITKIAVNTFVQKAVTIPISIHPHDRNITAHVQDAKFMEDSLKVNSGLKKGFKRELKRFILDYLTQDNGAFMLVMGAGPANGPVVGPASGIMHLDANRCIRTGNPEFPVKYLHTDGKTYMMHYTRIIFMSNLPSAEVELNEVGYCPVTCSLMASKEIRDVYTLSSEKMGSRPQRRILYAKKGATIDQLIGAVQKADEKMNNEGLTRFAKTLLLAPKLAAQELELGTLDLASLHDGFDRHDVTLIDITIVAAAFGLTLFDLAVSAGMAGQTRANAEVQEKKGRGKGVGEFMETLTAEFDQKYLPDHLYSSFDNQDDSQDEQQSNIWNVRSQARERDMTSGATTVRVERMRMLRNSEITQEEFEDMELLDGRLPDGNALASLFFTGDVTELLNLGVTDPTDIAANDPLAMQSIIKLSLIKGWQMIDGSTNGRLIRKVRWAIAALTDLQSQYKDAQLAAEQAALAEQQLASSPTLSSVTEANKNQEG